MQRLGVNTDDSAKDDMLLESGVEGTAFSRSTAGFTSTASSYDEDDDSKGDYYKPKTHGKKNGIFGSLSGGMTPKYFSNALNSFKLRWRNSKNIKFILIIPLIILILCIAFFKTSFFHKKEESKIVIILAVNDGGGVERWKTPEEWSVERSSIANKKAYAEKHGYTLALKDTSLKRRYSHEWREGWEKADILKQTMREYPNAEWFWWLDMYTFIMEPELDLESYLLNNVEKRAYRAINHFNPLKIKTDIPFVNTEHSPVNLILAQDCGGFNLGSFFIRRSEWTDLFLDLWWDPVYYEQMHMIWEHKEQDCLEAIYANQPWVRNSLAFVPLKAINSFPEGACYEQRDDPRFFYNKKDRDFIVNMAGCNFGDRSCWGEYEKFKKLRDELHRPWYKSW